uniref:Uncharacterized protein n=1 Tax=Glossina palpalis gambiensis TaxID=67801 RepID=A0A1B0BAI2_9MUSC
METLHAVSKLAISDGMPMISTRQPTATFRIYFGLQLTIFFVLNVLRKTQARSGNDLNMLIDVECYGIYNRAMPSKNTKFGNEQNQHFIV